MIRAGDETLRSEIDRRICSLWHKEELPQQWKESIIVKIHKKGDKTEFYNYSYQLPTKFFPTFFWSG
jgi:hypothetical protein